MFNWNRDLVLVAGASVVDLQSDCWSGRHNNNNNISSNINLSEYRSNNQSTARNTTHSHDYNEVSCFINIYKTHSWWSLKLINGLIKYNGYLFINIQIHSIKLIFKNIGIVARFVSGTEHREPPLGQGNLINIREFLHLSHFHFPFLSQHQVISSQLDRTLDTSHMTPQLWS